MGRDRGYINLLPSTLELLMVKTSLAGAEHGCAAPRLRPWSYGVLQACESSPHPVSEHDRRARDSTRTASGRTRPTAELEAFDRLRIAIHNALDAGSNR